MSIAVVAAALVVAVKVKMFPVKKSAILYSVHLISLSLSPIRYKIIAIK